MPGRDGSTSWLIDKSALWRIGGSPDAEVWLTRIERGLVQISTPTMLEVGYSARNADDWEHRIRTPPLSLMPVVMLSPAVERRAVEVQAALAHRGHHRGPSIPDLLIAAIAEIERLVVLHVDKDFELIADHTGQPTDRLRVR
jgi:predicted nucleic acid-binding protein